MTDLLKQLKSLMTPLVKHIEILEEHNDSLRGALTDLLEEEDLKMTPGYELLKNTYEAYLEHEQLPALINSKSDPLKGYDPIHAPPSTRRKNNPKTSSNAKVQVNVKPKAKAKPAANAKVEVKVKSKSKPAKPKTTETTSNSNYSSSMPDLDSCMLGEVPAKSKSKSKSKIVKSIVPPVTHITTKEDVGIYFVEIEGKQYYMYDKYFYDTDSMMRVGELQNTGFQIDGKLIKFTAEPAMLQKDSISDDYLDYYSDIQEKNIYKEVKPNVLQTVGTIEDGDCMLW